MNETELSQKLSKFLAEANEYKSLIPPKIRKRFHKVSSFFAHSGVAGAVGLGFGIGSAALAVGVAGVSFLVATPLFCIATMLAGALTQTSGLALQYAFGQFDPNNPDRQKEVKETLTLITALRKRELSPTAQKNLEKVVSLLDDKEMPPSFWSETNTLLKQTHLWYKSNPNSIEQSKQFEEQVSEFQKQFNLQPQPKDVVAVESHPHVEGEESARSAPTIIKL